MYFRFLTKQRKKTYILDTRWNKYITWKKSGLGDICGSEMGAYSTLVSGLNVITNSNTSKTSFSQAAANNGCGSSGKSGYENWYEWSFVFTSTVFLSKPAERFMVLGWTEEMVLDRSFWEWAGIFVEDRILFLLRFKTCKRRGQTIMGDHNTYLIGKKCQRQRISSLDHPQIQIPFGIIIVTPIL